MSSRTVHALSVTGPGEAAVVEVEEPQPGPGDAWIQTLWSGVSAGTEVALLRGDDPHHRAGWDPRLRVFGTGRLAGYPIVGPGYMEVGRVQETDTDALRLGQVIAMPYGHRTGHCVDPASADWVAVPDGLDPILGVYLAQMGPICANGLLHAAAEVAGPDADPRTAVRGTRVAVMGAGVVGLLTALMLDQHGAQTLVVEPSPQRRAVAEALGLEAVADDGQAWRTVKERWFEEGSPGADVALQCRGHTSSLVTALKSLRPHGAVVDLAFYQHPATELVLGEEFHHNWLSVRCAQIGRVPRGMEERWDRRRLSDLTLDLLRARGGEVRRHLLTDVVDLEEGPALLTDLAARRRSTMTAVLRMS